MKRVLFIIIGLVILIGLGLGVYWFTIKSTQTGQVAASTRTGQTKTGSGDVIPSSEVHPILDWSKRIVGGTLHDKWLTRDEMAKYIHGGEKYQLYSQTKFLGEYTGARPVEEGYLSGDKGYRVEFEGEDKVVFDAIFGISGNWNALPRIPQILNSNFKKYEKFVKEVLVQNDMPDAQVIIKNVYKIDLEGDGTKETFIVAHNISEQDYQSISECNFKDSKSKYSLVIMVKGPVGKEKSTVISSCYKDIDEYRILFIADVDGDGTMEFMIDDESLGAVEAEGFSLSTKELFDLNHGEPLKVLTVFSNPV